MSRSGGDRAFGGRSLRREAWRRPNSACAVCAQQHQHASSIDTRYWGYYFYNQGGAIGAGALAVSGSEGLLHE